MFYYQPPARGHSLLSERERSGWQAPMPDSGNTGSCDIPDNGLTGDRPKHMGDHGRCRHWEVVSPEALRRSLTFSEILGMLQLSPTKTTSKQGSKGNLRSLSLFEFSLKDPPDIVRARFFLASCQACRRSHARRASISGSPVKPRLSSLGRPTIRVPVRRFPTLFHEGRL